MAVMPLPPAEVLRQLLRYEPITGKIFWLERGPEMIRPRKGRWGTPISTEVSARMWNCKHAGTEAFCHTRKDGYLGGTVAGKQALAHRIAWCLHYGEPPKGTIDHINGDRADNRIANLRDCPMSVNAKNLSLRKDNKYGVAGIRFRKRSDSERHWLATIKVDGKSIHLGSFATLEEATRARREAERQYGFHQFTGKRGRGYYRR
jgi:hypothetical protein